MGRVVTKSKLSPAEEAASQAADGAMARYAQGDSEAFADVYDSVSPRLFAFARRHCPNESLVEDLVQETFARMVSSVRTFAVGSEVMPWARAILRNLIADATTRRRLQGRELLIEIDDQPLATAVVSAVERPDDLFDAKCLAGLIGTVLSRLSAPQRNALELVIVDGRSCRQAAAELGTTELGVRLRVHRAVTAIRSATATANATATATAKSHRQEAPPEQRAGDAEKHDREQMAQQQVRQVSDRTPEVHEDAG